MQNLERFGIILTFFAGFLLSPEIIGLNNLRRFEENLETILNGFNQKTDYFFNQIQTLIKNVVKKLGDDSDTRVFYASIPIFGFSVGTLYFFFHLFIELPVVAKYGILIYLLIAFVIFLFISISFAKELPYYQTYHELIFQDLPWNLDYLLNGMAFAILISNFLIVLLPFNLLVILFLIAFLYLYMLILTVFGRVFIYFFRLIMIPVFFIKSILNFALRKLEGDNNLQAIIKSLGIIFMILGALLDFISTF